VASSPNLFQYRDIPISSFAGWDRFDQINGILTQHDYGQFRNSALLVDAMERDNRISGVTGTRVGGLVAAPVEVKPANGKARAARVARELGGDDDDPGIIDQIVPESTLRALSHWGTYLGIAVGEWVWKTGTDRWMPRLKLWHPQFVYWNWSDKCYVLMTQDGLVNLPRTDVDTRSDGKWFVWTPFGYQYGWLRGLVRSLSFMYLMRQWNYRDWARYNEVYGKPMKGGVVPAGASEESKDRFENDLVNLGDDAVIMLPQLEASGPKGDAIGYDVKLIEAKSRGYQTFGEFKKELDVDIAIAVLGQDLPSQTGGGGLGASKGADIRDHVRLDKRIEDAEIWKAIREQGLTWWAGYNFGDPELAPRPEAQVIPEETETEENQGMLLLGQALTALDAGSGGTVDKAAILERQGIPILSEEEIAAAKAQKIQDAREAMEAGGGGPPFGGPGGVGPGGGNGGRPDRAARGDDKTQPADQTTKKLSVAPIVRRRQFAGLPVAVENEAGSVRLWTDGANNIGTTTMQHDYGYIEGAMGADGEEVDVYLGPDEAAPNVHVVHQLKVPDYDRYDEDKVMLGFHSADEAKAAYVVHRNDCEKAIKGMSIVPLDEFKRKLRRRTGTGPIRASAVDVHMTERAILALLDRAQDAVALRSVRTSRGNRRAKTYGDMAADRAKAAAARALAPDLASVIEAVKASKDPADLRKRLPALLRGMRPDKIAEITERARILSNLGGRLAAMKEVEK
jgi:phage gp29-like protein